MNSEIFVEAIKRYVRDAAVEDTIANLKKPPGRQVSSEEKAHSEWYNNLSAVDVDHVNSVISTAAHQALFGLLATLDGARVIDDDDGRFELIYVGEQRVLLNDPQSNSLHDLLNATD